MQVYWLSITHSTIFSLAKDYDNMWCPGTFLFIININVKYLW